MADKQDIVKEAREAFEKCKDADSHNRDEALNDVRFAKLGEQWPSGIASQREADGRPVLTINKLPAFIRQVVNDSRQNKPSIKVKAADSNADPETAEIINGLIRNIEYTSNADVAYDTAIECAVTGGVGYIRVGMDYAHDDAFDMDITIERVINPFSVYPDPHSTSADGSDWNVAFIVDRISKAEFKRRYKGKADVDFDGGAWGEVGADWLNEDGVLIAEYWTREEIERDIVLLSDGRVFAVEDIESDEDLLIGLNTGLLQIKARRKAKSWKVKQTIVSGVDVLEENNWPGRYIPIVPVYGDEFNVEGKRYSRSLIHPAKDAQRMFNYWRTTSTELVALAPRVPYIGPEDAFSVDHDKWSTANTKNHAYIGYKGPVAPMRQPLDSGPAGGALQEALNASDDIKSIIGMYDASLGARSNETSGKAILARQREGDVSTFHFIDNLSRAIRHVGKIIIDLIPHIYNAPRILRVLGEDGQERNVPVNQEAPRVDPNTGQPVADEMGQAVMAIHDLTAGKYDLTVSAGPSFTTRREEAAAQMTELVRAYPAIAPLIGDILAKQFDWPEADKIAERLEKANPQAGDGPSAEIQQMIEQGKQTIQQLQAELEKAKAGNDLKQAEIEIKRFEAETDRMKLGIDAAKAQAQTAQFPVLPA